MDTLRKLVSGNRRRFTAENVNLDLTYITPNIIAMSYPSSGLESLYRNPIDKVTAFVTKNLGCQFFKPETRKQLLDHQYF